MKNVNKISKIRISLMSGFLLVIVLSSFSSNFKPQYSENLFFIPDFAVEISDKSKNDQNSVKVVEISDDVETDFYLKKIFKMFF